MDNLEKTDLYDNKELIDKIDLNNKKDQCDIQKFETSTQDDDGIKCPICFTEYSSTGDHRVSSLKCGHLFGYGCILEWYDKRRVVLCPICGAKCPKSQLRIIFSSKIISFNTDNINKLHDQYISELNKNKKLKEEICNLKTEIDVLKLNTKTECQCQIKKINNNLNMEFVKKFKLNISTKSAILIYDEIDGSIIISSLKNNIPTIFKFVNSEIIMTKSFNSILKLYISNLKSSEGNLYLSIGKDFYIVNNFNFNTIYTETLINRITTLEIHFKDRDLVLFGDDRGFITINLIGIISRNIKICKEPIHSVVIMEDKAYIGTVYNVYLIRPNCSWRDFVSSNEDLIIETISLNEVQVDSKMCCVNIFGQENKIVIAYRLSDNNIIHYFIDTENKLLINLGLKQIIKYKEQFYEDYLYLIDQFKNKIYVVDINGEKKCSYQIHETVVGFCVADKILIVLSEQFLYVFKKTG